MHLKEGIRVSVSAPGIAELRLFKRLTAPRYADAGLRVLLWPSFDAYDLGLVFPDGTVWAVDVKDWSNPVRLAREAKDIPREPAVPGGLLWSEAFLVPSADCCRPVRGYVKTLRQRLKQRTRPVNCKVISERALVARVRGRFFGEGDDA